MGGPVGKPLAGRSRRAWPLTLGLAEPVMPWHTDRTRMAQLAAALGGIGRCRRPRSRATSRCSPRARSARLREGGEGRGGSSAMAHKRNPVAAVSVLACTHRVPGLVATLLAAMEQEHQRAAGAWQAEWGTLSELLSLTGSAAAWLADLLDAPRGRHGAHASEPRAAGAGGRQRGRAPEQHLGAAGELVDRALAEVGR